MSKPNLVLYDHKYGTDYFIPTEKVPAEMIAAYIILQNIVEVKHQPDRREILTLIADEKYEEARSLFNEVNDGNRGDPEEILIVTVPHLDLTKEAITKGANSFLKGETQEETAEPSKNHVLMNQLVITVNGKIVVMLPDDNPQTIHDSMQKVLDANDIVDPLGNNIVNLYRARIESIAYKIGDMINIGDFKHEDYQATDFPRKY